MKGQRGFALVITLIITALLVALCAEFVNEVYVDTSARQSFSDGQQASLLADSGMAAAIKFLQFRKSFNTTNNYPSQEDLEQLDKLLNFEDERGTIRVTVEDESGKLNINSAWGDNGTALPPSSDIAVRLVKNMGLSPDMLNALADWRDTNDEPNAAGAEAPYYEILKPPYAPRNGKLETIGELRLVKGFDGAVFSRLSPFFTVYEVCSQININTAPKEVIAALSEEMTADLAKSVVEYRNDHPFKNASEINTVPGMAGKIDLTTQGALSTKGTAFRIHSVAIVNETRRIIEAVVNSDWQVLYWREY